MNTNTYFVVYNVETTKIVGDKSHTSERAAKAALTRECTKSGANKADFAVAESKVFHAMIEKTETRHGVGPAQGKTFEVAVNTSWTSGPWSETYWSS
jgi:hypothetical protein